MHNGELTLNVFALLPSRHVSTLPASSATSEATEWLVIHEPVPLAFPTHTAVVTAYFSALSAAAALPASAP